jgi:hypothetical protein
MEDDCNDMGAFGGPGACDWSLPTELWLAVATSRSPVLVGDYFTVSNEGGVPGNPMALILADVDGVPFYQPLLLDSFCADGRWHVTGQRQGAGTATVTLRTVTIDSRGLVAESNDAILSLQ